jgi:4a-hydroxytetrahydrobiopterin dehydratase
MAILSDIEIRRELGALPGWTRKGIEITKTFRFPDFPAAVAFVQTLVPIAESMNHHPDIDVRYNQVTVRLSTHDKGGITKRDLDQAARIERLVAGE